MRSCAGGNKRNLPCWEKVTNLPARRRHNNVNRVLRDELQVSDGQQDGSCVLELGCKESLMSGQIGRCARSPAPPRWRDLAYGQRGLSAPLPARRDCAHLYVRSGRNRILFCLMASYQRTFLKNKNTHLAGEKYQRTQTKLHRFTLE